jgi:hypothetical protein
VFGLTNDRAEGNFAVQTTSSTNILTYEAKGVIPTGQLETSYTNVRPGGFFVGSALPIISLTSNLSTPSVMTATTAAPHGLMPGSSLLVYDSAGGSQGYEGNFFAETVPNGTTFTYTAKAQVLTVNTASTSIYARNDSFFIHRPFDGGVLIGTFTPTYGMEAKRQSKKYFRYQSGKGILFSTGTLFASNLDVSAISRTASIGGSGSLFTITTDQDHGLQPVTQVTLNGIISPGYNGNYAVYDVVDQTNFRVSSSIVPTDVVANLGTQPRIFIKNWTGAVIRTGLFDDSNGIFWEYDGNTLSVVKRSSTFQTAGTVSVTTGSYAVTGSLTRFQDQMKVGDTVNLRGMAYRVTSITSQTSLSIIPAYRGIRNAANVKLLAVREERIPQSKFNKDKIDGTGKSGYNIDVTKMQMLGIQYSWYGAGFADFMIRGVDGNFITAHRFKNNNINNEAYMRSGNLPARYEVGNYGQSTRLAQSSSLSGDLLLEDASYFPTSSMHNLLLVL